MRGDIQVKNNTYRKIAFVILSLVLFFIMAIPSYADANIFKKGDQSSEIVTAQAALKKLGFFNEVCTGYFGEVTEAAVIKFQKEYKLDDDGILGPITVGLLNKLSGENIIIPSRSASAKKDTTKVNVRYRIKKGDTIWDIAAAYNVSVDSILQYNGLNEKSILDIGREIIVPNVVKVVKPSPTTPAEPIPQDTDSSIPFQDSSELGNIYEYNKDIYVVKEGDTLESIAEDFGVSAESINNENNFNEDTIIQIGQEIKIPEGSDAEVPDDSIDESDTTDNKAEYLDWFKEVQYIYKKGDEATVTDVDTGKSFKVRRLYGGNHADTEPLTSEDTKIMKSIYGGSWSWDRRAIIVTVKDDQNIERKIAASMNGMPHGGESIGNNGMKGHFCIHFKNSRTHSGSRLDPGHQNAVKKAAGI
jgi:LysM repeat protein